MSTRPIVGRRGAPAQIGRRGAPAQTAGASTRQANYNQIASILSSLFGEQMNRRIPHMTPLERIRGQGNGMGAGFLREGLPGRSFNPATGGYTRLAPGAIPTSAFNGLTEAQRNMLTTAGIASAPAAGANFMQLDLSRYRNPLNLAGQTTNYFRGV